MTYSGMAEWSLKQDDINAQKIAFLEDLYSSTSQAMTDLIDELRVTHAIK